jgi:hypothetical protein
MDRNAFASKFSLLLDGIEILAAEIAHRRWVLMIATGNDTFYLGDNPTVLQRTDNPRDSSNLGFDVAGVEAFLPLIEGFSHFVTSMTAPIASGWSGLPGGACTHWKAPPLHGAHPERTSSPSCSRLFRARPFPFSDDHDIISATAGST